MLFPKPIEKRKFVLLYRFQYKKRIRNFQMKFTYFGQSCFLLAWDNFKILFDPFISPNEWAKDIDIQTIEADYIFVSHGHEDHVADLLTLAKQTQACVVSNFEICTWVQKQGYDKVHPMNFGNHTFDIGKVHFVPAQHSSVLPDGSNGGNPGGFILKTSKGNVYYSGDTCLSMEMQLIPKYASIDVAIMPIGGNFTMDAEEAIMANEMIQAQKIVGVHFDTFGYIKIDHEACKKQFQNANIDFVLPEIGKEIEL